MATKTPEILTIFKQINSIPRCSQNEQGIRQWLVERAQKNAWPTRQDAAGNLVLEVAATPGLGSAPVMVLQGHMDMVCEKTPDADHDFSKDAIQMKTDGDWLTADRTTLGADNGIALAIALALAEDSSVAHPPLELLFTVDEERGLRGAQKLPADFLEGRIYLNIDSETEGVFTVGCAGGEDSRIRVGLATEPAPEPWIIARLAVDGLVGGHSGIDIDKQRANANKLLARALDGIRQAADIRIVSADGGTASNAIPRNAQAIVACDPSRTGEIQSVVARLESVFQKEYAAGEPSLALSLETDPDIEAPGDAGTACLSQTDTLRMIRLLLALPHGVAGMSAAFENLVETSNNLARVRLAGGELTLLSSQRSSVPSRLTEITAVVEAAAALAGATTRNENAYPTWPPDMASALLGKCRLVYRELFREAPVVEAIHAGLECAVIGSKYADMDMISFGPTIENPHSPDERLFIPSIERVWEFICALTSSIGK